MTQFLLMGNPNAGKTTLFNALTNDTQKVGNWPGVTVEKKTGSLALAEGTGLLIDLPGLYTLSHKENGSQDELIAAAALFELETDCIINVVDACHLERHLYLTSQLLELGKPLLVVLTMMDVAQGRGISIDVQALEKQLGCPVVGVQAHKKKGLEAVLQHLAVLPRPSKGLSLDLDPAVYALLEEREAKHPGARAHFQVLRQAEAENLAIAGESLDILLAESRYNAVHALVLSCQKKRSDSSDYFTAQLDKVFLHRILGLPLFFLMMYGLFWVAMNIGGALQGVFDSTTESLFVDKTAWVLGQYHAPPWLVACLAYGLGKGLNIVLTFIPVIASIYFFLSLLESSGYMARAAFVVDKIMRVLGLPGKSFVPMLVGFGCNVPAIMAARTLDSTRDRLLTVMMSPFMSCSARLAIYAVFVAAFFPSGGQNVVFSLYLIGIIMAVLTGLLLKKKHLQGQASPLIIELPAYHRPTLRRLLGDTHQRLRLFILRAGKYIIPLCVVLGALNALSTEGSVHAGETSAHSLISWIGQGLRPLFAPMGIEADNWPASVGLLTGVLAKEVVVGTLRALYSSNLSGALLHHFDGAIGAYAYLLFILLYIPCISTMAVIRQEAGRFLMWLSIGWSLMLAYAVSVGFYQLATFFRHPLQSLIWLAAVFAMLWLFIAVFFLQERRQRGRYVIANS